MFFRKRREATLPTGMVRADSRTKNLVKRLHPGEIAMISHLGLDWVAAESLMEKRPATVLNTQQSTSGRYPNQGPKLLLDAEIPLIGGLGNDMMSLKEGQQVEIRNNQVYRDEKLIAEGVRQTQETDAANMEVIKASLGVQTEALTANTMKYLRRERNLLLEAAGVSELKTNLAGRQVLMVMRDYNYKENLQMLRPYIREYRPALIGVDGGADALLENGLKPDLIVGDMDSVTDTALKGGAEIVVHTYTNGKVPGLARIQELGMEHVMWAAVGTSEDVTMLLADEKGADLIMALGTHATLLEFLNKERAGMSLTFLACLKVDGKLIDAKKVSELYRSRISNSQIGIMMVAELAASLATLGATAVGQVFLGIIVANLDSWWQSLRGIIG